MSDHFDGRRFFNPAGPGPQPFSALARTLREPRAARPARVHVAPRTPPPLDGAAEAVRAHLDVGARRDRDRCWYDGRMTHDLPQTIALLARTPASLDALLRGMPDAWTRTTEGAGTWAPFDVVAHLIHAERTDWMPRVRTILDFGESKTFEPFDRSGHERERAGASIDDLLDEFAGARAANLERLRAHDLRPADLDRRGRHPALGTVTLSQLLATWAVHDLTHLHQLSRVMAHQYRAAVGPWSRYLGVLQCAGHSAPA